ncbi:hypothetical protein J7L02_00100, partial [Candidatus Woesearchaeota archaeon]|nr:hypothetical protein [Candidatus Woesearchaeota archaeon]
EKNLIPTKKDTFLSLQIFGNPAFWGYRNEILYKTKELEVDIATIEYLPYTPIFEFDKKTERIIYKDITQTKKYFIINAFGVERMELVSEGLDHISEISLLKPQTEIVLSVLREKDRQKAHAITQGLMALHYVISECNGFSNKKLGYDFQKANISSEQIGKRGRRRRPILNKLADLILSTLSDEEKKRILNKDFLSLFFEEDIKTKILDSKLVNSDKFIQMFLEFISKRQEFINNKLNFKLT